MKLRCNQCGKTISTEVPEETIIRAWCECPECIERNPMSYKQIDKQFDEKWYTLHDAGGFEVSEKVREFIHLIYDQAKAEQREEDARIAENKNIFGIVKTFDYTQAFNQACADIATAIRQEGK